MSPRKCPDCGATIPPGVDEPVCLACTFRGALSLDAAPPAKGFGDYELIEEIARGGMGVIYQARQKSLNRTVALKMILKGQLATEADVRRFRAEGQAVAHLQHPNIVAIHEIGEHNGQHFFSMEYIEGPNLAELAAKAPLPARRAAAYVKTIAEAIHYAHEQGILHRDLKPSNILINKFEQPQITDFGLAKRIHDASDLTASGQILGTPNFMPPEQAAARRGNVGPHSDVYSLGAILYFLLTGKPLFQGETSHETIHRLLNEEPVPPSALNPDIARDLQTICLKCLEKVMDRRYESARALAEDLERFLRDEPIQARPVGRLEKGWRTVNRHPVVTALLAALVLLTTALLVLIPQARRGAGSGEIPNEARPIAPMPTRSGQGVSGVINGKVYITSPLDGHPGMRGFFHVYDPDANSWKRLADVPTPRTLPAAGVIEEKLYVAGGNGLPDADLANLEVYDPKSDRWTSKAPMSRARTGCAAAVFQGRLYVFGGSRQKHPEATVESYDPMTDTWKSEPPLLLARNGCGAIAINDTIYIIAGFTNMTGVPRATGLTELWKPSGKRSFLETSIPIEVPVAHGFFGHFNGLIYMAGGNTSENEVAELQIFSPQRRQWSTFAAMPEARWGGSGAHVINGEFWVFGGWTSFAANEALPHPDIFAYDRSRNRWRRSSAAPAK